MSMEAPGFRRAYKIVRAERNTDSRNSTANVTLTYEQQVEIDKRVEYHRQRVMQDLGVKNDSYVTPVTYEDYECEICHKIFKRKMRGKPRMRSKTCSEDCRCELKNHKHKQRRKKYAKLGR